MSSCADGLRAAGGGGAAGFGAGLGGGWGHHHFHHRFGFGLGYGDDGCYVRRPVLTPFGYRIRIVNVCY